MTQPDAFIFDLDGVIADTLELHEMAWKRLATEAGIPFSDDDMQRLCGLKRREGVLQLFKGRDLSEAEIAAFSSRKNDYYREQLPHVGSGYLLAGVAELMHSAKTHSICLGVASSSTNAKTVLHQTGIYDLMDSIADGHTVERSKPAPDIFLWVAEALGVAPEKAIVFEDAAAGVQGALEAGMFVIGLGDPAVLGAASVVWPNLADKTLDDVLAVYSQL